MRPRIEDSENLKTEQRKKEVEKKLRKKQDVNNTDFKKQKPQGNQKTLQGNQKKLQGNTDIKKCLLERLQLLQQGNIDSTRKQLLNLQQGITDFNRQQMGNMHQQRLLLTRLGNIDFNRAELEKQRQLLENECDKHVEEVMKKQGMQPEEKKIEVGDKKDRNDVEMLSRKVKPQVASRRQSGSILFEVKPSASPAEMEIIEKVVREMIDEVMKKMKFKEESEEVTLGMDKISLG